jgi:hypothetical protein
MVDPDARKAGSKVGRTTASYNIDRNARALNCMRVVAVRKVCTSQARCKNHGQRHAIKKRDLWLSVGTTSAQLAFCDARIAACW